MSDKDDGFISEDVKDKGKQALDKAKQKAQLVYQDSKDALIFLVKDPMGGQGKAVAKLSETKAITVGATFCILFAIAGLFLAASIFGRGIGFSGYVRLFVACLIPPLCLFGGHFAIGKFFGKKSTIGKSLFSAGVASLPLAITMLLGWLFYVITSSGTITGLFTFFGLCISVLLINASLLDVLKVSTQQAVLLTPTMLVLSFYIAKILYKVM